MTLAILGGTPVGSTADHRSWPEYDEDDIAAACEAMTRGPYGADGPVIREAEERIAAHFGAKHAYLVNSATDGLTAAQLAVGVGAGDAVLQPAYSFQATPQSTLAAEAVPYFADVRCDTFTLDPVKLDKHFTRRVKAIMPVSMHGGLCDVELIQAIADSGRVPVIWDNAQSAGGSCNTFTAGTAGTVAVISLNYKKIWCADQGGVVLTDDPNIDRALRQYGHYGFDRSARRGRTPSYWTPSHGVNLAPPNWTAGLAVSRLAKLPSHIATAQHNMTALIDGLSHLPGLILPAMPEGTVSTWSRPRVGLDPEVIGWTGEPRDLRDRVITALQAEGLPVRSWQEWPLPAHPAFRHEFPHVWSPHQPHAPQPVAEWDADDYPVTAYMLNSSIMLADDPHPLWDQPLGVVTDHYIPAFRKVWADLGAVMEGTFEVVQPGPVPARL